MRKFLKKIIIMFRNRLKSVVLGNATDISLDTFFEGKNKIYSHVVLVHSNIGLGTYISSKSRLLYAKIGRFCSIGQFVQIGLGEHPTSDWITTHPAFFSVNKQAGFTFVQSNEFSEMGDKGEYNITIGNDVWIGNNVIIMNNVNIGNGAIIGAGAIVTDNIPPYAIAVGVPARIIKYRFSKDIVNELEKYELWNKDYKWLQEHSYAFKSFDLIKEVMDNE